MTRAYRNRQLNALDREARRRALAVCCINKGSVNSGAIPPDHQIADGVVALRIVEGHLTAIEVAGNNFQHKGVRFQFTLPAF